MRKKVEKNTTAKKTVEKKAVNAVKVVEPEIQDEGQAEVKAAEAESEVKTEETASEAKAEEKPAAKAAAKKPAKTTAAKKTVKKETEAKPARATKASASQKVILQMSGREELSVDNIINRVKEAYVAEGHSAASIKNVEVYIKPEEGMAYYVIDDYASGISLY